MCKLFKGFIFCLVLLLTFLFNVKTTAANTYFVWEKTEIDVPIFSNIEDYKDDYIVKLYVDGKISNDFTVEMEVNCSTFSTVLTNKIGRYTVYYKAYSKNNYLSSVMPVVFNVVDVTPPQIKLNSKVIEVEYGLTLNDYDWYNVTDDVCSLSEISISIDDSNVIYNTTGTYPATIKATDLYSNQTTMDFMVKITDGKKPNILVLKPLEFSYGEEIVIEEYFLCKDNYNNDITHLLNISGLDTKRLGKQEIVLSLSDYSNNQIEVMVEIVVVDKIAPTLTLSTNEVTLDVCCYNEYDINFFREYIYILSDNYSTIENIVILIDTSGLKEEVADYNIYYTAFDENGNKKKEVLLVKMREMIGPNILVDDVIKVKVGSEVDLYSLVEVVDEYDSDAYKRLSIEYLEFDANTIGTYEIKYTCFNTSGIYSEKNVTIIVYDEVIENSNSSKEALDFNTVLTSTGFKISVIGIVVLISTSIILIGLLKKKKSNK